MRAVFRHSLVGVAALFVSTSALGDNYPEARQWLQNMATAMVEQTYQGTFVYVRGQSVETVRVTHVYDDLGVRERMFTLTGSPREIIRDSSGVTLRLGEGAGGMASSAVAQSMFPEIPVDALDEARQGYLFEIGDLARIAGFMGRRVTIIPRDQFRYGYDLWLEENSGMLLRWVLYDQSRRPLAKLMFTDLQMGDQVEIEELESQLPPDSFVQVSGNHPTGSPSRQTESSVKPQNLPPGFKLAARSGGQGSDEPNLEHLVYSDGLASVSVYIEMRDPKAEVRQGLSRMGTTYAFSTPAGQRQVTAIGEVPAATVQAIGRAFATTAAAMD